MPLDKESLHRETLAAQGMGRVAVPYRDIVPPIHVLSRTNVAMTVAYPAGELLADVNRDTLRQRR